jgi:hypothetical protein
VPREEVLARKFAEEYGGRTRIVLLDRFGSGRNDFPGRMTILDCGVLTPRMTFIDFLAHPWSDTYEYNAGLLARKLAVYYPEIFVPRPGKSPKRPPTKTEYGAWYQSKTEEKPAEAIRAMSGLYTACGKQKMIIPYFEAMARRYPDEKEWARSLRDLVAPSSAVGYQALNRGGGR